MTTPLRVGLAQRFVDPRDPLAAAEVEAHVDHLGAVGDREADALGDVGRRRRGRGVEDPDRHQLGPVGEPGQPDPVVGLLGDRAGDVGAVAVFVERQRGRRRRSRSPWRTGRRPKSGLRRKRRALVAVGDAGVEHGDGDAFGARAARLRRGSARRRPRRSRRGRSAGRPSPAPSQGRKFHCLKAQPPTWPRLRRRRRGCRGRWGAEAALGGRRGGGDVVGRRVVDPRVARAAPPPPRARRARRAAPASAPRRSPSNLTTSWRGDELARRREPVVAQRRATAEDAAPASRPRRQEDREAVVSSRVVRPPNPLRSSEPLS